MPRLSETSRDSISTARSSRSGLRSEHESIQLTEQQLDIWEHAALLYHAYEWQAAADTFEAVSITIEDTRRRALCLLNTALVQARLGDYDMAASTLQVADLINQTVIITPFLTGVVAYELQDYFKAESCFETCLDGLKHAAADCSDLGLDFVLEKSALITNLQAVQKAQYSARWAGIAASTVVPLGAIPAECIFEAPERSFDLETSEQLPTQSNRSQKENIEKRPFSMKFTRPTRLLTRSLSLGSSASNTSEPSPASITSLPQGALSSIAESSATPESDTLISPVQESLRSPVSPPIAGSNNQRRQSWRRRPSTPYTPRDARVRSDPMKELSTFIRRGGHTKVMVPKDAKGEHLSMRELSSFMQKSSPKEPSSDSPQPLALDPYRIAELRQARMLDDTYDRPAQQSPTYPSPTAEIPSQGLAGDPLISPPFNISRNGVPAREEGYDGRYLSTNLERVSSSMSQHSASLDLEKNREASLKLLKPAVYKPTGANGKQRRISSDDAIEPPTQQAERGWLYPPTPPGANDPLMNLPITQRRQVARTNTLDLLEGRRISDVSTQERLLPPDPGGGHSRSLLRVGTTAGSPSSIATSKFFDWAMGKKSR